MIPLTYITDFHKSREARIGSSKICSRCGIEKDLKEFRPRKQRPTGCGVVSRCKKCEKEVRAENSEHHKELHHEYYQKNKEKINNKNTNWAKENPEEMREIRRRYNEKNADKIKIKNKTYKENKKARETENDRERRKIKQREYYKKNKSQLLKKNKERRKARKESDYNFLLKEKLSHLFRETLRKQNIKKGNRFFSYTGIPLKDYVEHFRQTGLWSEYTGQKNLHIDHIIPCNAYDFKNEEDIKRCWNPLNLRIIPAKENILKKDTIDFELIKKYKIEHLLPESYK